MPPFLTSFVAIRDGRLTAYTSAPYFWPLNHAVAQTEEDINRCRRASAKSLANLLPVTNATDEPFSLVFETRHASNQAANTHGDGYVSSATRLLSALGRLLMFRFLTNRLRSRPAKVCFCTLAIHEAYRQRARLLVGDASGVTWVVLTDEPEEFDDLPVRAIRHVPTGPMAIDFLTRNAADWEWTRGRGVSR